MINFKIQLPLNIYLIKALPENVSIGGKFDMNSLFL